MVYLSEQPEKPATQEGAAPEPPRAPEAPQPPSPVPEPPRGNMGELRTIQTLVTVSIIAGPVSMVIGGVLLSTVALVCALVAFLKARRVADTAGIDANLVRTMRRQAVLGLAIGIVALVLNAVTLAMLMPAIIEAVQAGDLTPLVDGTAGSGVSPSDGQSGSSDAAGTGSVWG